ncbi:MAG: hypothetical protein GX202_04340 [Firmicutes bacterium]|nr:hypothetical protein [Bacillota bacterium]
MKSVSRFFLRVIVFFPFLLLVTLPCLAQTELDDRLDQLATRIVELMAENTGTLEGPEKMRLAVLDFPDLGGQVTGLGRFVAEELTTRLFLTRRFEVIERQLLNKVLDELKLSAAGFVDSSSAQELGKILGVSAVVSGTISPLATTVRVNARVITTTTGKIVAATSVELPKDEGVMQLLQTVVPAGGGILPESETVLPGLPGEGPGESSAPLPAGSGGHPGGGFARREEQTYQDRIEQALSRGEYLKAYSLCQEALAKYPAFAFAYAALGYTYLRIQPANEEQALLALEKAVALAEEPWGDGFAHYLLGRIYANRGRRLEARLALEKAALRYQVVGIKRSPEDWYNQAIRLCLELYREEIEACWAEQDYARAINLCQQAIDKFKPAFAYTARGYSLLKSKPVRAAEALESLLAALALVDRPYGDGWTYYLLGWAYWETGDKDKAREALERAITSTHQSAVLSAPAWETDCLRLLRYCYEGKIETFLANGEYEAAIDFLEGVITFLPDFAYAHAVLGYSYLMADKAPRRALEVLERAAALEEAPVEHGWTAYLLGWAYQRNGRYGPAVDALGKALRQAGEAGVTPEWAADGVRRLADSYDQLFNQFRLRGGNISYYLVLAEASMELLPEYATGYAVKGYCLTEVSAERTGEALTLLQQAQALKEDPTGDGWIYYAFGRAYNQKGERKTAMAYLEQALRRGAEAHVSERQYWYRQCNLLYQRLSKQHRSMYGLAVTVDSAADDPYLMLKLGSEKGRPFNSFTGLKLRLGVSSELWRVEAGGELAWEGDLFPPMEFLGWYVLLGGGMYGVYGLNRSTGGDLDLGLYFGFETGLRFYFGEANRFCLTVGAEHRFYPAGENTVAFGVNLGLPVQ